MLTGVAVSSAQLEPCKSDEVRDPVCTLCIKKEPKPLSMVYKGVTYYFCSDKDLQLFKANPDKYAGKK
jgi:YHS domain-containing protein